MDLSKLLNVIRGNKAADASAAPKDRPETEPVIPVEVSPTVAAADHPPPPVRTSGSVVQSLLGQFTGGHREPSPPTPPKTPPQGTANGYDDVLASVLPPGAAASSPATTDTARKTPPMDTAAPSMATGSTYRWTKRPLLSLRQWMCPFWTCHRMCQHPTLPRQTF
ncbi:hypothetical protein [Chloracidobacterium aggregatum]|uniref:hypothetical protein n=1 Tax=Chloracidobacterium aggregatum TaxID=2851959 RepID=UPI001B8C651B|nr:hypothetical protein [Chloracidobacterium aggregatum]QUV85242.1 hypothetical protein J8C03_02890 [Chloracidobacterium sp. 2]QUV88357.1 hypothetical protein J8C07_03250 [Chloracidobacterium sp. S]